MIVADEIMSLGFLKIAQLRRRKPFEKLRLVRPVAVAWHPTVLAPLRYYRVCERIVNAARSAHGSIAQNFRSSLKQSGAMWQTSARSLPGFPSLRTQPERSK